MSWRVSVDDSCVGSGMCIAIAKEHFRLDREDRSHPTRAEMAPDDAVLDAAMSCPMEAIRVVDATTGEVVEG